MQSRYHKVLRVSMCVVALVLIFDGGFFTPVSKKLSDNTIQYLANSIGVLAEVSPNDLNVITAELTARDRDLDLREAALGEREIAARDYGTSDYSVYMLSTILFILTVLIVLNYAMDWMRVRKLYAKEHEGKTV